MDTVASEEVVRLLEEELAAARVCDASHASVLLDGVERVIGSAATVSSVVATTDDDRAASRLVVEPGSGAARRFLPDVAVTQRCAVT